MDIFDVIGPAMIGPSSSHTAGAARIGKAARELLGVPPCRARIGFHGSFARTYQGHGTDKAIVGGLLGMQPDDERLKDSLGVARREGLVCTFERIELRNAHPNSVRIELEAKSGKKITVTGSSIGGGSILINRIDDYSVLFDGKYATLVIPHRDTPGVIAGVTHQLAQAGLNVAEMRVYRSAKGGDAVMVIETDESAPPACVDSIEKLPGILEVMNIARL